jgi:F-box domain
MLIFFWPIIEFELYYFHLFMEGIPLEILGEILAYLNNIELCRARRVAKRWQMAIDRAYGMSEYIDVNDEVHRCSGVRDRVCDDDIGPLCDSLTTINLSGCQLITGDILHNITRGRIGTKKALILDRCYSFVNYVWYVRKRENIESIRMRYIPFSQAQYVSCFGRLSKDAPHIDLIGCNVGYEAKCRAWLANVVSLKISRPAVDTLAEIMGNKSLRLLVIDGYSVNPEYADALGCAAIERLELIGCDSIPLAVIEAIRAYVPNVVIKATLRE